MSHSFLLRQKRFKGLFPANVSVSFKKLSLINATLINISPVPPFLIFLNTPFTESYLIFSVLHGLFDTFLLSVIILSKGLVAMCSSENPSRNNNIVKGTSNQISSDPPDSQWKSLDLCLTKKYRDILVFLQYN